MSRRAHSTNRQILEEASTWFVALRSPDIAQNARRDFHDWLKSSPEHIRAYLEIAAVYADIPAPEQGRTPPELIEKARASAEVSVVALNVAGCADQAASVSKVRRRRFAWRGAMAFAASVLIFAAVGTWLYMDRNSYRTGIGEQRSITLSDGSIIELNARSRVRVAFRDTQRDVELLEGQALFRVAKDSSRPFVVYAGDTSVRAVGTEFDVYRRASETTVTVLEGRVAVLSARSAAATPSNLAAGEQMIVSTTAAEKTARPNLAAATAWTRHELVFDGTPLRAVLEEFSRYTSQRLSVDSPELAELRISGQYTSTNVDSLLRFLKLQKGVVVTEVDGEVHIRRQ